MWTQEELDFMDKNSDLISNYGKGEEERMALYEQLISRFGSKGNFPIDRIITCLEYLVNGPQSFWFSIEGGKVWFVTKYSSHLYKPVDFDWNTVTEEKIRKYFEQWFIEIFQGYWPFIGEITQKASLSKDDLAKAIERFSNK